MNRTITFLSLVLIAACQTGTSQTTDDVEQAATASGDCIPGDNYLGASLPALPLWNGAMPQAGAGQMFMDVADWRKDTAYTGKGFHVAVLADPGTGKVVWGATVPDGKMSSFRGATAYQPSQPQIGDCCRPPPCPCHGCCDGGLTANWMARNFLEASLRYIVVPDNASVAAGYKL